MIRWRWYTEADEPQLREIYEKQAARCGVHDDETFADPLSKPHILPMVLERNGKILGLVCFELIPEMKVVATDPRFALALESISGTLKKSLARRGLKIVTCDLEPAVTKQIGKVLTRTGFKEIGPEYGRYFLKLEDDRA